MMEPIKVLALIFGIGVLLKMAVAVINPKPWVKMSKRMLKHTTFMTITYLVLIVIVGAYVLTGMSIVQIAAAILLASLLLGLCLLPYSDTAMKLAQTMLGKKMLKKDWLAFVIWAGLAVWAIYAAVV